MTKKSLLWMLVLVLLISACAPKAAEETDEQMATRVAQILTAQPTSTADPALALSLTPALDLQPIDMATATLQVEPTLPPTATAEPTLTETPTEAPTPTETPTITPTLPPTSTPPSTDPRSVLGSPSSTDSMDNNTKWNWPLGSSEFASNEFKDGHMNLIGKAEIETDGPTGWILANTQTATNMYVEATYKTTACDGRDAYGIIFRVPVLSEADRGYIYEISCEGEFRLWKWDGKDGENGKYTSLIAWQTPKGSAEGAINAGDNATNRLGVLVKEDLITVYVNGFKLGEARDGQFVAGNFGLVINPQKTEKFTVQIEEMSYWLNP
ncbi:MAG: hypothetical protein GYA48_06950 [Chloroflexi bacterium]|nr:hypothetical protein [Chloroflexota bacterium]